MIAVMGKVCHEGGRGHPLRDLPKNHPARTLDFSVNESALVNYSVKYKRLNPSVLKHRCIDNTRTPHEEIGKAAVETAEELEKEGVKFIGTNCGFFAYFHDDITNAVDIPIASSSLLQIPLISKIIGKDKRVGILTYDSRFLSEEHLRRAGVDESTKTAIIGLERSVWKQQLWKEMKSWPEDQWEPEKKLKILERTLVEAAESLISKYPDVGAILLECTAFPGGAYAVQKATGLPVFDFSTLYNWVGSSIIKQRIQH